jgi:NAD(P)-dependent dehydrogenase (short-subunit alcohol dehydrogenase family)
MPPISVAGVAAAVTAQVCDVSSLASVAAFATEWLAASRPLQLLLPLTHTPLSHIFSLPLPLLSAVMVQVCDVSSLASVAAFAAEWLAASRPLHLLVNNAGVLVSVRGCRAALGLTRGIRYLQIETIP